MASRSSVSALVERSPRALIRGRNVAVGSRVSTRPREAERSELVRWAILVGAGVFATTFAQPAVLKLPLQYLLKSDLHVSRDAMAAFFAAGALAWYFKPLAGILSDSVPLFGTRRRHYLLLSGVAAGGLWLLIGLVPRTYAALLAAVIAMNAMLVVGSTVVGGVMVEIGQRYRATGRLSSARYFVQNACVLLGGPVGGFLATRPFELTAVVGAAVALSVVPVAWWLLQEPPVAQRSVGGVDEREGAAPDADALGHAVERRRATLPRLHRPGVPDAALLLPDRHPRALPGVHWHAGLPQRGVWARRRVSLWRPLPAGATSTVVGARHCAQRSRHALLPLLSLRHGRGPDRGRERSPHHARGAGADGSRGPGDAARERRARLRPDDERAQRRPRGFGHLRLVADRAAPRELLQPRVAQRGHDRAGSTGGAVPTAAAD